MSTPNVKAMAQRFNQQAEKKPQTNLPPERKIKSVPTKKEVAIDLGEEPTPPKKNVAAIAAMLEANVNLPPTPPNKFGKPPIFEKLSTYESSAEAKQGTSNIKKGRLGESYESPMERGQDGDKKPISFNFQERRLLFSRQLESLDQKQNWNDNSDGSEILKASVSLEEWNQQKEPVFTSNHGTSNSTKFPPLPTLPMKEKPISPKGNVAALSALLRAARITEEMNTSAKTEHEKGSFFPTKFAPMASKKDWKESADMLSPMEGGSGGGRDALKSFDFASRKNELALRLGGMSLNTERKKLTRSVKTADLEDEREKLYENLRFDQMKENLVWSAEHVSKIDMSKAPPLPPFLMKEKPTPSKGKWAGLAAIFKTKQELPLKSTDKSFQTKTDVAEVPSGKARIFAKTEGKKGSVFSKKLAPMAAKKDWKESADMLRPMEGGNGGGRDVLKSFDFASRKNELALRLGGMSLNTNPRPIKGVQERRHGNEVESFNFEEKRQKLNNSGKSPIIEKLSTSSESPMKRDQDGDKEQPSFNFQERRLQLSRQLESLDQKQNWNDNSDRSEILKASVSLEEWHQQKEPVFTSNHGTFDSTKFPPLPTLPMKDKPIPPKGNVAALSALLSRNLKQPKLPSNFFEGAAWITEEMNTSAKTEDEKGSVFPTKLALTVPKKDWKESADMLSPMEGGNGGGRDARKSFDFASRKNELALRLGGMSLNTERKELIRSVKTADLEDEREKLYENLRFDQMKENSVWSAEHVSKIDMSKAPPLPPFLMKEKPTPSKGKWAGLATIFKKKQKLPLKSTNKSFQTKTDVAEVPSGKARTFATTESKKGSVFSEKLAPMVPEKDRKESADMLRPMEGGNGGGRDVLKSFDFASRKNELALRLGGLSMNASPRPMEGVQERGHGNEVESFNFEEKRQKLNNSGKPPIIEKLSTSSESPMKRSQDGGKEQPSFNFQERRLQLSRQLESLDQKQNWNDNSDRSEILKASVSLEEWHQEKEPVLTSNHGTFDSTKLPPLPTLPIKDKPISPQGNVAALSALLSRSLKTPKLPLKFSEGTSRITEKMDTSATTEDFPTKLAPMALKKDWKESADMLSPMEGGSGGGRDALKSFDFASRKNELALRLGGMSLKTERKELTRSAKTADLEDEREKLYENLRFDQMKENSVWSAEHVSKIDMSKAPPLPPFLMKEKPTPQKGKWAGLAAIFKKKQELPLKSTNKSLQTKTDVAEVPSGKARTFAKTEGKKGSVFSEKLAPMVPEKDWKKSADMLRPMEGGNGGGRDVLKSFDFESRKNELALRLGGLSMNASPRPMEGVQERGHGNEVESFNFEEKRQQLNWKLNLVSQVPTLLMNHGELNVTNPREVISSAGAAQGDAWSCLEDTEMRQKLALDCWSDLKSSLSNSAWCFLTSSRLSAANSRFHCVQAWDKCLLSDDSSCEFSRGESAALHKAVSGRSTSLKRQCVPTKTCKVSFEKFFVSSSLYSNPVMSLRIQLVDFLISCSFSTTKHNFFMLLSATLTVLVDES
ncbi:unnamed protein product [Caenorhabditis sp. 36 PRJEB53466]|nr:unnamed protein product [Caenorhabditis sp. 36 PRJEB53466]